MREIRIFGDPVLRKRAVSVEVFDDKLKVFLDEMIEVMVEKDGVGLAAPQVGESVRIAVIDASEGKTAPYILINPEIINASDEIVENEEGCLSLPGLTLKIKRPAKVSVKALDENGKEYIIENAEDLLARALQHEIDHLNGIMIIDHISALQRKMISGKLKKMANG